MMMMIFPIQLGQVDLFLVHAPPDEDDHHERAQASDEEPEDVVGALGALPVEAVVEQLLRPVLVPAGRVLLAGAEASELAVAALGAALLGVALRAGVVAHAGLKRRAGTEGPAVGAVAAVGLREWRDGRMDG